MRVCLPREAESEVGSLRGASQASDEAISQKS